jgi:CRISPR type IV-associated protein Csf3
MYDYKPLRIRAYPRCGIISDQYLPLDGILYYQLVRKTYGEQIIAKPGESNIREGGNIRLPFKKCGPRNDTWFYTCSFAQWSYDVVEDNTFKVKQLDFMRYQNYLKEHKKVEIARGKFKPYHIKIYYRHCSYIEWYCNGLPYDIADLLRFCTHIGKNSGDGWGEVMKWKIQDWPEDWSVRGNGNKLMRAVPDKNSNFLYGLRPSYWNSKHIFPCKMP